MRYDFRKTLRITTILICMLLVSAVVAFIYASDTMTSEFTLTPEESEYIKTLRNRPIVIAYSYDLARVDFDGEPYGLLDPVADILQNELGLTVEFVKIPWNQVFTKIDNGEVDFYGPISISEDRRQNYNMVRLRYRSQSQIVTRVDELLQSMSGLHNRSVGLLEGAMLSQTMRVYLGPNGKVIYFPNIDDMIESLRSGEIDAFASGNDVELEVLRHDDIRFEFAIENYSLSKGMISARKDMQMLSSILDRYIAEKPNGSETISNLRHEALMQFQRKKLSKEIAFLQENYDEVTMYADSTFYPLCYAENGIVKGMQLEINDIFKELTGVEIKIITDLDTPNGIDTALEKIKSGEYMALGSCYYDTTTRDNPSYEYSPILWMETIRTYSYRNTGNNLLGKSFGTTRFASDYLGWSNITGKLPVILNSHWNLIRELNSNTIDAVVMGEMNFNYGYSIIKDYELHEITGIAAEASIHMLYGSQNAEFNAAFNDSIALFQVLNPQSKAQWKSQYDKYKTDYIRMRHWQQVWMAVAIVIFSVMLAALIYLLRRVRSSLKEVKKDNRALLDKVHYDALTGIYNRRYMEENLKQIIKSLRQSGGTLSVLMIDVDFFKRYNDTYGHSSGDGCLISVAEALADSIIRNGDFVARYGGEEFAVVLPDTDEGEARRIANQLIENVRLLAIPHEKNEAVGCVTISVGGTTGKAESTLTGADFIKQADKALYAAKQNGRNKYTFIKM